MPTNKDVNKEKKIGKTLEIDIRKMTFLSFSKQHLYNSENVICDSSMQTIIWFLGNSYRLHMSYVRAILNVLFFPSIFYRSQMEHKSAVLSFFFFSKVICFSSAKDKTENI